MNLDNDALLQALHLGLQVDIRRTDGRVHSACVASVNLETRSVTVEWFEKGETKGKEIEVEAILDLNPDVVPSPDENNLKPVPNKYGRKWWNFPIENKANNTLIEEGNDMRARKSAPPQKKPAPYAPRPSNVNPQNKVRGRPTQLGTKAQNGTAEQNGGGTIGKAPTNVAARTLKDQQVRKRSNVVKEVEKLKQKREERRARQQEQKVEKEAMMNVDPGNPNWEFLNMIKESRSLLDIQPLRETDTVEDHQITVCVRKRPVNKKEKNRKEVDVITVPTKDHVIVHEPKSKVDLTKFLENQNFRFDYAFDDTASNELVYKFAAKPLIDTIFDGGMATCFAYGQTGSGKTHTMGGDFNGRSQDSSKGIYAMAARDVFKFVHSQRYRALDLVVSASFFEIYSGKVFDLLHKKSKLRVLEDGKQQVQVVGLTETNVEGVDDVLKLIHMGNVARTSGQTSANQHSSRSHAVFQIILRKRTSRRLHGKFSLIDLAGNERGADTSSANRQTRMEGAEINKSLLALKECIRALGRKGAHLPFRASKLTQVLRDSFIGDKSRTCMIAMISPCLSSCEHTLNTLRYADRVKELGACDPATANPDQTNNLARIQEEEDDIISRGVLENGNDLAQLRSLNEGDFSADLYNLQETINHLNALEDDVLETHSTIINASSKWLNMDASLYAMTNEVDYDVDAYVQQLEDLLAEKIESLHRFKNKVALYREKLSEEETISRNIHK